MIDNPKLPSLVVIVTATAGSTEDRAAAVAVVWLNDNINKKLWRSVWIKCRARVLGAPPPDPLSKFKCRR